MKVRQKLNSSYLDGETEKGNKFRYNIIPESSLVFAPSDTSGIHKSMEDRMKWSDKYSRATTLILECSFSVTTIMADLLESSKILLVDRVININDRHQIHIKPLPAFSYTAFNDIIYDMTRKFEL